MDIHINQNTFLSALRPLLKFNRSFGLLPVAIKGKTAENTKIKASRTSEIYCVVIVIVLYVSGFSVTKWQLSVKYQPDLLLYSYWYCRFVVSALIHASCWFDRQGTLKSLQKVDAIKPNASLMPITSIIRLSFLLGFLKTTLLFLAQTNFFPLYGGFTNVAKAATTTISDAVPTVVLISSCSEFVCQVAFLRYSINELNQDIQVTSHGRLTSTSLRHIILRHQNLRQVCSVLNRAYGRRMFLVTTAVFLEVTYVIFYSLNTAGLISRTSNLSALLWAILHIVPIILVMHHCQRAESEAEKLNYICCDYKEMDLDITYRKQLEVQEWSLRLRQLPIKFTAWGFFNLNGGQLETIMFTIMSYIVILLQNNLHVRIL